MIIITDEKRPLLDIGIPQGSPKRSALRHPLPLLLAASRYTCSKYELFFLRRLVITYYDNRIAKFVVTLSTMPGCGLDPRDGKIFLSWIEVRMFCIWVLGVFMYLSYTYVHTSWPNELRISYIYRTNWNILFFAIYISLHTYCFCSIFFRLSSGIIQYNRIINYVAR